MEYKFFLDLALILFLSKFLGIFFKRLGFSEIIGALVAGLILGPTMLGFVEGSEFLQILAEIGVVMVMFTAGMETDLKKIKSTGVASVIITILGVIVPLGIGFVVACLFNGGFNAPKEILINNLFYGVLLVASSVSITVATLKELGKLSGKTGTAIVSAAIIDDIIGLLVLAYVLSLKDTSISSFSIILNTFMFFGFAVVFGFIMYFVFKFMERRYSQNRRMSILSLVFCFLFAYIAESVFHISDITGAFIAGVVISNIKSTKYIESRIEISAYMMFAPILFASIGINNAFGAFDANMLWFGIVLLLMAILTKVVGCGLGAKISGFNLRDSLFIGVGMIPRAEVLLITAQKGIDKGFLNVSFIPYILAIVFITSLITPILLKITNSKDQIQTLMPPVIVKND